jgi:hypothetical protein
LGQGCGSTVMLIAPELKRSPSAPEARDQPEASLFATIP